MLQSVAVDNGAEKAIVSPQINVNADTEKISAGVNAVLSVINATDMLNLRIEAIEVGFVFHNKASYCDEIVYRAYDAYYTADNKIIN